MLFTFPSQYLFTIGLSVVFSLGGWCRRIQTGFRRSRPTQDTATNHLLTGTGLSPSMATLPKVFPFVKSFAIAVLQPQKCRNTFGLGYFPFARHYLGNHYYFLFLRLLRCFSSPGLLPYKRVSYIPVRWVAPFGNQRINGYLHLPVAYRSLSRPSSPLRAKASPVRS